MVVKRHLEQLLRQFGQILVGAKILQLITAYQTMLCGSRDGAREMVYRMSDRATMKIGFLSLPLTGHLNRMTALARKLQSRGHEIVFIGVPDIEPVVRAADLDFVPFGENEYPPGSIAKRWGRVANLHGLDVVQYSARELTPGLVKVAFEHLPGKVAETGVNALILDTAYRLIEI